MKRLLLLAIFITNYFTSLAQTNTFPASGNVGIGTTTPLTNFQVNGTGIIGNSAGTNYNENLRLPSSTAGYSCLALGATPAASGTGFGQWSLVKFPDADLSKFTIRHNQDDHFSISTSGNVGIGTVDTKGYKLAVAGNMIAESVKVKLQGAWPDYVFDESYKLPSLRETEAHIKEKGHLPGIPSVADVKANGIDLGDMNAKLLEKIEELTLHLIEMKKENEKQNKEISFLKSKLR